MKDKKPDQTKKPSVRKVLDEEVDVEARPPYRSSNLRASYGDWVSTKSQPAADDDDADMQPVSLTPTDGYTSKLESTEGTDAEVPKKSKEDPVNNSNVYDVLEEFAGGTSVHGLPYALDRSHTKTWKRIVWYLILFTSLGLMLWQIGILVRDYRGYRVITSTSIEVPDSLPFPQVTVCDANAISQFNVDQTGIKEPRNETQLKLLSDTLDEFIYGTTFNDGEEAPADVWKPVITPLGLCFTFTTNKTVNRPGYFGGLYFFGLLDQQNYVEQTQRAGVAVIVHQEGTKVTYQSPFTFVEPGADTLINIEVEEYQRETDAPWSNCTSQAPEYTQGQCRAACEYKAIRDACKCREWGDETQGLDYCTSDLIAECDLPDFDALVCDCARPPCSEEVYPSSVSTMRISESSQAQVAATFGGGPDFVDENLFVVTINYKTIRKQVLTESKALTFTQLLSAIGGTMGLFLGISFISVIEVFGELCGMRLAPRLWGDRRLHGAGSFA